MFYSRHLSYIGVLQLLARTDNLSVGSIFESQSPPPGRDQQRGIFSGAAPGHDQQRGIFSGATPGRDRHRGIFSGSAPGLKVRLTLYDDV